MLSLLRYVSTLCFLFLSLSVVAQNSPIPMLEKAAQNILTTLKNNQSQLKEKPEIIHSAVRQFLLPIVDTRGMARSVLGRQAWRKATSSEKNRFIHSFTKLVIRTYSNPLAEYKGETIHFFPLRGRISNRFIRVNSEIKRPNGQNIPLSYSLVAKKDGWKIYDLSIEGVSLLQSFRSQFSHVLQTSSMETLIKQIEKKRV